MVILVMGPRTHIGRDQFRELNWLPVEAKVTMARLTMVHKIKCGEVPTVLRSCFRQVNEVHNHFTNQKKIMATGKGSHIKDHLEGWRGVLVFWM